MKQKASADETVFNQEDADAKRKAAMVEKIRETKAHLAKIRKP